MAPPGGLYWQNLQRVQKIVSYDYDFFSSYDYNLTQDADDYLGELHLMLASSIHKKMSPYKSILHQKWKLLSRILI